MRKLFALILILGVLACALGFYAADTFETSDYYRVLNPVFRTAVGQDIDPDTVKDAMAIHVDGNLPGVGEFNFSLNALIDGGVDLPGLGACLAVRFAGEGAELRPAPAGKSGDCRIRLEPRAQAVRRHCGRRVMAFLLIGTHRPKRRR